MPDLAYGIALSLTIVIELPIVTIALVRWYQMPVIRAAVLDVAANLLTHPTIWFVLAPALRPRISELAFVMIAEGFAWLTEGLLFAAVVRRDSLGLLLLSLAANLTSFLVGVALQCVGLLH